MISSVLNALKEIFFFVTVIMIMYIKKFIAGEPFIRPIKEVNKVVSVKKILPFTPKFKKR